MSDTSTGLFEPEAGSDWIRLRTLILLRWSAILGQIIAINVAQHLYNLQLELGWCYLAVGASIIANLISTFVFPENKRLAEGEATLMILFDVCQLSFLLFLTGGLNNPFAVLILAPVTISATVLQLRSTFILGVVALCLVTALTVFYIPLRTEDGMILRIPDIFLFGFWCALVIGLVFLAFYARRVTMEMHTMSKALLATQMALAREQKLTDLGGVIAATAHELGTPLATIKLVSAELMDELSGDVDLFDDARLIRDQADRCRDILRSMGQVGKDDLHLRSAPLSTVIRESADPHLERGKNINFSISPIENGETKQPIILRRPEIIHGIRNLVQNAVDFSDSKVWISAHWSDDDVILRISDDGTGYPPHVIGRLGDPFMRRRRSSGDQAERPGYEGMGLGLFIAKTLLERSGAVLNFANGTDPFVIDQELPEQRGAIVEVRWRRDKIEAADSSKVPLGLNKKIEI
ncbi:sensor histidine kinase RegB [Parasulfitobacter algicola]|uniref:histidine kinase n=1 Tax=Parasulfitobacter algicola TaxID=2614809 RepID=A0ABX2ITJ6_9RHOB|nr:ActS/PrrB/RegB family redox-sensitive histidine kinase [Sulfitobacter algicola]NSX53601.1 ActS/PrrB/RegB family redox-sensitive histidine kinase [Sulfitobacter algicola]